MTEPSAALARPTLITALARGWRRHCPRCGRHTAFAGYLRLAPTCGHCAEPLGHIRADDFPPYVTIVVVGHLIVPLILLTERTWVPPMWLHLSVWLPLTALLTLTLLPRIKGSIVGLMWHLGLKGDETQ